MVESLHHPEVDPETRSLIQVVFMGVDSRNHQQSGGKRERGEKRVDREERETETEKGKEERERREMRGSW